MFLGDSHNLCQGRFLETTGYWSDLKNWLLQRKEMTVTWTEVVLKTTIFSVAAWPPQNTYWGTACWHKPPWNGLKQPKDAQSMHNHYPILYTWNKLRAPIKSTCLTHPSSEPILTQMVHYGHLPPTFFSGIWMKMSTHIGGHIWWCELFFRRDLKVLQSMAVTYIWDTNDIHWIIHNPVEHWKIYTHHQWLVAGVITILHLDPVAVATAASQGILAARQPPVSRPKWNQDAQKVDIYQCNGWNFLKFNFKIL